MLNNYYNAKVPKIYLAQEDLNSLGCLSKIKDSHHVIDVYQNGTVSEPYESEAVSTSAYRSFKWIIGASQNSADIKNIQLLMQRSLSSYLSGCDQLKPHLTTSLEGLRHLQEHYQLKSNEEACKDIEEIIQFVERNLLKFENKDLGSEPDAEKNFRLNQLEASTIGSKGKSVYEGISYYENRIKNFLLLESRGDTTDDVAIVDEWEFSMINELDQQDRKFLEDFAGALEKTHNRNMRGIDFTERKLTIARQLKNEGMEWGKALDEAYPIVARQIAEEVLEELHQMTPENRSQIGLPIPMEFQWDRPEGGHAFFLSLCQEADGTYTVAQANTGAFSLVDPASSHMNIHLNTAAPISLSFPPIVEFNSLNHEEAVQFLMKAAELTFGGFDTFQQANTKYKTLFQDIHQNQRANRVPARRSQITGNCTIRSLKELMIYSLQKSGKVDLANRFMKYVDGRTNSTLPFEDVQPFLEADG